MTVRSILDQKGHDVLTIAPQDTLERAASVLAANRIGALVVTDADGGIAGILSERDIVRAIGEEGPAALAHAVSTSMTTSVKICNEGHTVQQVMTIMTRGRFRHLPVERDGKLIGIVSIGDVVKRRIEDAEREAQQIKEYIATA